MYRHHSQWIAWSAVIIMPPREGKPGRDPVAAARSGPGPHRIPRRSLEEGAGTSFYGSGHGPAGSHSHDRRRGRSSGPDLTSKAPLHSIDRLDNYKCCRFAVSPAEKHVIPENCVIVFSHTGILSEYLPGRFGEDEFSRSDRDLRRIRLRRHTIHPGRYSGLAEKSGQPKQGAGISCPSHSV